MYNDIYCLEIFAGSYIKSVGAALASARLLECIKRPEHFAPAFFVRELFFISLTSIV